MVYPEELLFLLLSARASISRHWLVSLFALDARKLGMECHTCPWFLARISHAVWFLLIFVLIATYLCAM